MKKCLVQIFMAMIIMMSAGVNPAISKSDCNEPIPELFNRVSRAVVAISALGLDSSKNSGRIVTVSGSGFIIDKDGLVLTNSHVVFDRQAISLTLDDGRIVGAKLLGADPIFDLAVLRISAPPKALSFAILGNSDSVRIGEEAIAVGNPFGLEQTLTRGVVSGVNRILPGSPLLTIPLIQTDASINPGNSGGPLMNRCGEVIGINTLILADAQNIGFAIPINVAKNVIPELIKNGRVIRPWIGFSGKQVDKELMEIIKLPLVEGFLVEIVDSGSPAQKAGIKGGELSVTVAGTEFLLGGDIITAINGRSLKNPESFFKVIGSLEVGDKVNLTLFNKSETRQITLILPERPILPGDIRTSSSSTLQSTRGRFPGFPIK
jgi:serine protease Do